MRAFSLVCLLGLLTAACNSAFGQYPARPSYPPRNTNQPQQQAQPPQTAPIAPPGSGGKVMYFSKPADALVPLSGTGEDAVAQVSPPALPALGTLPDVSAAPSLPSPAAPSPSLIADPTVQPGMTSTSFRQQPTPLPKQPMGKQTDPSVYTVLPPREDIFNLLGDADLEQLILKRLRDAEAKRPPDPIKGTPFDPYARYPKTLAFPVAPPAGGDMAYVPKTLSYPPMQTNYDALYVIHRRLHFEDKNSERAGWDLGFIQPAVSAVLFYKDVLLWPHSLASGWSYGFWDTSAGKCLPGSPTPYMLYPPELTITGSVFEGVIITGAAFAIP